MKLLKNLIVLSFVLSMTLGVKALEPFVVEDIKVDGLQRVELGTFFTYLPLRVGETLDAERVPVIIRQVYASGSFEFVKMEREGQVLKITVVERPTISNVAIDGNSDIKTEQIEGVLKQARLTKGEVLDREALSKIKNEIENQYFSYGKYNVKVNARTVNLSRNRVQLKIDIDEGSAAKIKEINLVGNKVFGDEELLDQFALNTGSLFSYFTNDDQYAREKLSADLETLASYYQDRGYLKFAVTSTQVAISPDKKNIFITINVEENNKYTVSDIKFLGDLVPSEEILRATVPLQVGDTYSGAAMTFAEEGMTAILGRFGYAFAKVTTVPELDEEADEVALTVYVEPGKRTYVNRITFTGNAGTNDHVLRREVRLEEGSALSTVLVERSKLRLQRLPYVEEVEVETPLVPGEEDLVDVNFTVKERSAGSVSGGIGYSNAFGISLNGNLSHSNFLGTGKSVGVSVNRSLAIESLNLNYADPYFTSDGESLAVGAFFRETDFGELNIIGQSLDSLGFDLNYGIPLNEFSRLTIGAGFQDSTLKAGGNVAVQITDFFASRGQDIRLDDEVEFTNYTLSAAWSRNTFNRGVFPDRGSSHRLALEYSIPESDVEYAKVSYNYAQFVPLSRDWVLSFDAKLAYADGLGDTDNIPYFENYYAGGSGSIRGFEVNQIGPKGIFLNSTLGPAPIPTDPGNIPPINVLPPEFDTVTISESSVGGNARALLSAELIFPTPFLSENKSVRTSLFIDAGNVWDTKFDRDRFSYLQPAEFTKIPDFSDIGTFRVSAGLSVKWLSPLGPLEFSLAKAIKEEDGDETEVFSFNIGRNF